MPTSLDICGESAQEAVGAALAAVCPPACIIYLKGNLGAGKTTLVRGFIRELGHIGAVKSPTYTLLESYDLAGRHCYHLDLYRVADPGELEYLGIRDLLQSDAILLVEWPEKGEGELPQADLIISIHYADGGRRLILEPDTPDGVQLVQDFGVTTNS
ncbi:tRNA threonylcarbamoyladenosine biosynthesis protein TsaE [hydrothermal vent metagenome]|uniref:tRNA threonylcarbamoyladenosine biosynthesis protein TsaE n=1 Tax=hydrothermal vent metagenome TaxID=652676 RepID=A0A3B1BBQ0_9ZZZZ